MSPNTPTPPLLVTASVAMEAPSFVPGSVISATITLSAKPQRPFASSQSEHRHPSAAVRRPQIAQSASAASSMLACFQPSATARIDYVVAELSGRWTSDRSWLSSDAHEPVSPSIHLDNHTQAPQHTSSSLPDAFLLQSPRNQSASSSTSSSIANVSVSFDDPTLGPYAWSAALADANAVGGGGRAGHSGIMFRSHPIVVCEREQVPAGSQVSFCVEAVLPDEIPPTFRGSAMRYGYALVVVVKFPDAPVPHVIRVPFRVLPVSNFLNLQYDEVGAGTDGNKQLHEQPQSKQMEKRIAVPTPRDVGPRPNRFLQNEDVTPLRMSARLLKSTPPDDIEIALALSMNGRLTDYKPDVEHNRLVDDHGTTTGDHHSMLMSAGEIGPGAGSGPLLSSTSSSSAASASVLHYLPSPNDAMMALAPHDLYNGGSNAMMRHSKSLRVYSVTRGTQAVAKVYLAKRVHYLGDIVQIMFDFHGDRACYRIGARLEMHEVVGARYSVGYQDGLAGNGNGVGGGLMGSASATAMTVAPGAYSASDSAATESSYTPDVVKGKSESEDSDGVVFRKVYGDYGEFVTAARNAEVTFSIPHDAPASFSTGVVAVRWMLHFVFVIPQGSRLEEKSGNGMESEFRIDEEEELLRGMRIDGDVDVVDIEEQDDGWKGGAWKGEDPKFWAHMPDRDVDLLRWTLPIVVSGQPGSPWGCRNVNTISHVSVG